MRCRRTLAGVTTSAMSALGHLIPFVLVMLSSGGHCPLSSPSPACRAPTRSHARQAISTSDSRVVVGMRFIRPGQRPRHATFDVAMPSCILSGILDQAILSERACTDVRSAHDHDSGRPEMIDLRIDADGYELDEALRARINDRIGSLDEYMPTLSEGHVTVSTQDREEMTEVRAQVWGGKDRFEASSAERSATEAVDHVRHELETQIRKGHSEETGHHDHDGRPK